MAPPRLSRVVVRDFQSLEEIDLELGQLTVIVGPNSVGKSSLVRALQAAVSNWSGGDFVREGQKGAEVALLYGDHWLTWRKPRRGGSEYEIRHNGETSTITRAGKDLPPEVQELTGVREIRAEGVRATLQFAEQFELPFLLAATGGQAARLLARVSKLDALVTGQVLARRDAERERRSATQAEERAAGIEQQLAEMPDYEVLVGRWQDIAVRLEAASRDEAVLRQARTNVGLLGELSALQAKWRDRGLPARTAELVAAAQTAAGAATLVRQAGEAQAGVLGAAGAVQRHRANLAEVEAALHELLAGIEICPLCGQAMGPK